MPREKALELARVLKRSEQAGWQFDSPFACGLGGGEEKAKESRGLAESSCEHPQLQDKSPSNRIGGTFAMNKR